MFSLILESVCKECVEILKTKMKTKEKSRKRTQNIDPNVM